MKSAVALPLILLSSIVGIILWTLWRDHDPTFKGMDGSPDSPTEVEVSPSGMEDHATHAGDAVRATQQPERSHPGYTLRQASRDGTGKTYLGREIAQVMGHQGIDWLERSHREQEEAPTRAIAALALKPDSVVADIGAGSGYYTFRISPLVPDGEVVAVDIQPEMISHLEKKASALEMNNVRAHLGTVEDTKLERGSIDLALLVDAYHEFSHPYEMMDSIVEALRPGGRVILLEYREEDPNVPIKPLHKMSEAQVRKEMEAVGLRFAANHDFLPWQHFLVFEKPQK